MLNTTPQERLALGVVALLMAAGAGARLLQERPADAAQWSGGGGDADTLAGAVPAALKAEVDAALRREQVRSAPLAPGEPVDLNTALAEELERLPRVGPALAERLVDWRAEHGPFRTLADLDAVPGMGAALMAAVSPHLDLPARTAGPAGTSGGEGGTPKGAVSLNRASAAELEALPGVGPALAGRIVAWRDEHGPFRSLEQLEEVSGIGPALRARLAPHLRLPP